MITHFNIAVKPEYTSQWSTRNSHIVRLSSDLRLNDVIPADTVLQWDRISTSVRHGNFKSAIIK